MPIFLSFGVLCCGKSSAANKKGLMQHLSCISPFLERLFALGQFLHHTIYREGKYIGQMIFSGHPDGFPVGHIIHLFDLQEHGVLGNPQQLRDPGFVTLNG